MAAPALVEEIGTASAVGQRQAGIRSATQLTPPPAELSHTRQPVQMVRAAPHTPPLTATRRVPAARKRRLFPAVSALEQIAVEERPALIRLGAEAGGAIARARRHP